MALQGCRSIEMYRANLGDLRHDESPKGYIFGYGTSRNKFGVSSRQSGGQHYPKLDGKNSIRTVILRKDLAQVMLEYRQARMRAKEKLTTGRSLF
ncbi:MAG: hypothetical protein RLZZ574_338 [Cyanobacteriota bacterium]|jgi:integrase/recombinase XerD